MKNPFLLTIFAVLLLVSNTSSAIAHSGWVEDEDSAPDTVSESSGYLKSVHLFPGQGNREDWLAANQYYAEANKLSHSGQDRDSIALYKKAIEIYPHDADYFVNLGSALRRVGNLTGAEQAYRQGLSINPHDWTLSFNLSRVFEAQGKNQSALQAMEDALKGQPPEQIRKLIEAKIDELRTAITGSASQTKDPTISITPQYRVTKLEWSILGHSNDDRGLVERVGILEKKLFGHPNRDSLQERIAKLEVHVSDGGSEAQPSTGKQAPQKYLDPEQIQQLLARAADAYDSGQDDKAIEFYKEVLAADKENADANFGLGSILEDRNDLENALKHFRAALATQPSEKDFLDAVASVQRKLSKTQPNHSSVAGSLPEIMTNATMAFKAGNFGTAKELLERVVQQCPTNDAAQFAYGQCLHRLDDFDGAIYHIKKALKLSPKNSVYKKALDRIEREQDLLANGAHPRKVGNKRPGGLIPIDDDRSGGQVSLGGSLVRAVLGTAIGMGVGALTSSAVGGNWRTGAAFGGITGGLLGFGMGRL